MMHKEAAEVIPGLHPSKTMKFNEQIARELAAGAAAESQGESGFLNTGAGQDGNAQRDSIYEEPGEQLAHDSIYEAEGEQSDGGNNRGDKR